MMCMRHLWKHYSWMKIKLVMMVAGVASSQSISTYKRKISVAFCQSFNGMFKQITFLFTSNGECKTCRNSLMPSHRVQPTYHKNINIAQLFWAAERRFFPDTFLSVWHDLLIDVDVVSDWRLVNTKSTTQLMSIRKEIKTSTIQPKREHARTHTWIKMNHNVWRRRNACDTPHWLRLSCLTEIAAEWRAKNELNRQFFLMKKKEIVCAPNSSLSFSLNILIVLNGSSGDWKQNKTKYTVLSVLRVTVMEFFFAG